MRRITVAIMGTLSALVALFGYHTSTSSTMATAGSAAAGTGSASTGGTTSDSPSSDSSGSAAASSGSSSDSSGSSTGTFTGDAVDTRWGIVQVEITVADGKITKSEAVQYPNGNPRDQEINSFALPRLNSEAVGSKNGQIDAVSGATVTSDGYIQSLQSAIDQANL